MDPGQDAMKIAWNFEMQNRGDTYHYRRYSPNINPKNKSERVSDQEFWEFYFVNRTELDPKPAIEKNPGDTAAVCFCICICRLNF